MWRYLSFGRFVWMLKRKALWMARIDQLEDSWEGVLGVDREDAKELRRRIFVNCWTASKGESHAMWSVYCHSKEGVAVRTTLGKLRQSVKDFQVRAVQYVYPKNEWTASLDPIEVAVQKRRPFAYEREQRIVHVGPKKKSITPPPVPVEVDENNHTETVLVFSELYGFPLPWEPEKWLDAILLHPASDHTFRYAVEAVVDAFAPSLKSRIRPSGMAARPPGAS
jgi:hypothetical protein